MNKNIVFLLIIISSLTHMVYGQEMDTVRFENIVKSLKLDKNKIKTELCTEKKMPNAEDSYIVVIPVLLEKEEDYVFTIQNFILITDQNGTIKNRYFDPSEITSDAIMLRAITIDTGLYTIGADIRAFGVKIGFEGSSRQNPYSSVDISLYYPSGNTLKKVLHQFNVSSSRGEWDTNCAGEFEDEDSVILLDKAKTNAFTDLKIKSKITETKNKEVNGDCKDNVKSRTTYKVLKFRNGTYR